MDILKVYLSRMTAQRNVQILPTFMIHDKKGQRKAIRIQVNYATNVTTFLFLTSIK